MNIAIIVAAGSGIRMKGAVKKQYLSLAGQPILCHTLRVFNACISIHSIYLVVPKDDIDFCKHHIIAPLHLEKPIQLVSGGDERQDSVFSALLEMQKTSEAAEGSIDTVVIHDGVRPFISPEKLDECIRTAIHEGACILGFPVHDTLKKVDASEYVERTIERDVIWGAQTPQAFRYRLILEAHHQAKKRGYRVTDDASLVEQLGEKVKIIPGSQYNIKITRPEDLAIAEAIYKTGIR